MTTYDAMIYGSLDFHRWYRIGVQTGFEVGECPSFYPLPRATPDAGPPPPAAAEPPTHVHKYSTSWMDFVRLGSYDDGAPGKVGAWRPWIG
eukprot:4708302-Prymnesium_polylepis.1